MKLSSLSRVLWSVVWLMAPASLVAEPATSASDRTLADRAELILVGEVSELLPTTRVGTVETDRFLVAVEEVLQGELLRSPVTLRVASAAFQIGAGPGQRAVRLFSVGDRVLLFLESAPDAEGFDILDRGRGAFQLRPTPAGEVAVRHLPPRSGDPTEVWTVRDSHRFRRWLGERAGGADSGGDYFRAVPAGDLARRPPRQASQAKATTSVIEKAQPTASVSDPAGDAGANAIVFPSPDLRSATASVSGTTLTMEVRFHSGTYFPVETKVEFTIDIDQDPSTGDPGVDSLGNDGHLIASDYLIVITDEEVRIRRFDGSSFPIVDTVPSTRITNGFRTSLPLSLLGDDDGLFNFKATTSTFRGNGFSPILDYIPDLGKQPAVMVGDPAVIPAAPSSLRVEEVTEESLTLDWRDNSIHETEFEIQRRIGSGSFQVIASTGSNATSYQDTSVDPATTYGYRIRARNLAGSSAYSNIATATTAAGTVPTELTATALSASEIQLGWVDNAADESGFEVEMRSGGDDFSLVQTLPPDTVGTVVDGLAEATAYTFRVRATSDSGDSPYSNQATATTFLTDPEPCVAGPTTRCLGGGRFKVEIEWRDFPGGVGPATDTGLASEDSGLFYFFSPSNWEMLVKVLDGCAITNHFWVFAAATTDVEYTLTVTDSFTGFVQTYTNPLGTASPAITDTAAFATCTAQAPLGAPATASRPSAAPPAVPLPAVSSVQAVGKAVGCVPDANRHCLNQGRFQVEVEWTTDQGEGFGQVDSFGSADSGLFWFFSPNNLEMLVKVLDGCAFNDRVWVFSAATTDVEYTLRVVDTATGAEKLYTNPAGNAADAVTDTNAFDACP